MMSWSTILAYLGIPACSTTKSIQHSLPFEVSEQNSLATHLWSQKMPGFVTDLKLSKNGKFILAATVPSDEESSAPTNPFVLLFSKQGEEVWRLPLKSKIKDLEISESGEFAVMSTYDEKLSGIDQAGKVQWSYGALCKPMLLNRVKRVLCYYDDDSRPGVAYDLFDWSGKKLETYRTGREVLTLKVARDESHFLIALNRGELVRLNSEMKEVFKKTVPGEIVDAAITGEGPGGGMIAVIYNVHPGTGSAPAVGAEGAPLKGQSLALLDKQGNTLAQVQLSQHTEQVSFSEKADTVLVYGNGPQGQYLASYKLEPGTAPAVKLAKGFFYRDQHFADYSSPMVVSRDEVLVGFEDIYSPSTKSRHSHLFSFDMKGKVTWHLPLHTEDGAYLYAKATASDPFLVVATDRGQLAGYQVRR